jgi:menaquinone-dependent protoporphyrinogen IX oxidase
VEDLVLKTIVVYRSKTGFTRKYAEWIAGELDAELVEYGKFKIELLYKFDTIIYGGGLYAGGINGVKIIKKNLPYLRDKKIIVFATGATPDREETTREIFNVNFNNEQQDCIHFFYLRGGFDYSRLSMLDKALMKMLKIKLRIIPEEKRSPDETGMLAVYEKPADFTKEKYMEKLLELARQN